MLTAAHETTKKSQEVVATSGGALRVDPSGARYADLGLFINATNVAAGATVYSAWLDNAQWCRRALPAAQCDKAYSLYLGRRDSEQTSLSDYTLSTGQTASPTWWRPHDIAPTGPLGSSGIRFGIKNDDGSNPMAFARLRVQLFGS